MGFVERIFHPVVQAVQRAFTPAGTGGQEAAAQQAQSVSAAKPTPQLPSISAAPPSPPQFAQGQSPKAKQAQVSATSLLGAAAATGQTAKKSLLG